MATSLSTITIVSPKPELPCANTIREGTVRSRPHKTPSSSIIASPSNFQKIVAELVGTYVLIFVGRGAALVDQIQKLTIVGIGLVWGLVLMAMICTLGHISGGHFNPAVTISLTASRKLPWKLMLLYVLCQLLGAIGASFTLRALLHGPDNNIRAITTQYKDVTTDLEAITWEFLITFFLVFTICGVATDHRASKGMAGAAIGATAMFNVIIAGQAKNELKIISHLYIKWRSLKMNKKITFRKNPKRELFIELFLRLCRPITGASMNPARSLGPAIAAGVYKDLWVFIVSPVLGGLAAALIYSVLREQKTEKNIEITDVMFDNNLYGNAEP